MPEDFTPDPEDVLAATSEALDVQAIDGTPYPMLSPDAMTNDLIDRVVVWVASQTAGTEDQLLRAAGMILHSAGMSCIHSIGHRHDEEGKPDFD